MIRHVTLAGVAVALTLGLCVTSGKADEKEAVTEVAQLADAVPKKSWDELLREAQKFAHKHDLYEFENVYVRRKPNGAGLGIGPNPGKIMPDGIEMMIYTLARNQPTADFLKEHEKALVRAAEVTAASAAVIALRCPQHVNSKDQKTKSPGKWNVLARDTHTNALELAKAIKAKDAPNVRAAAKKLSTACTECHIEFRD